MTIKTELTVSSYPLQKELCELGSSKMSLTEQCIKHRIQQCFSKSFLLNYWSHTRRVMGTVDGRAGCEMCKVIFHSAYRQGLPNDNTMLGLIFQEMHEPFGIPR